MLFKSSGIPYANIHPNAITDTVINANQNLKETHIINSYVGDQQHGWACAKNIREASVTVLREGLEKHSGKDYYLSIELLIIKKIASLFS